MSTMRRFTVYLSSVLLFFLPMFAEVAGASGKSGDSNRLRNCGAVLRGILDESDNIPQDLLDMADCIVVFPSVVKATRIGRGSYGRGAMSCRQGDDFKGPWGAPTMMALDGGSFGIQLNGRDTDLVLLAMNECAARAILDNKAKLGMDTSVAAGPVGRDSSTGSAATLRADFLSYSKTPEQFTGVSLDGSVIRPDNGDNRRLYGRNIPARDIALSGTVGVIPAARELVATLGTRIPTHRVYARIG